MATRLSIREMGRWGVQKCTLSTWSASSRAPGLWRAQPWVQTTAGWCLRQLACAASGALLCLPLPELSFLEGRTCLQWLQGEKGGPWFRTGQSC